MRRLQLVVETALIVLLLGVVFLGLCLGIGQAVLVSV